jgi:hypothetical protein
MGYESEILAYQALRRSWWGSHPWSPPSPLAVQAAADKTAPGCPAKGAVVRRGSHAQHPCHLCIHQVTLSTENGVCTHFPPYQL